MSINLAKANSPLPLIPPLQGGRLARARFKEINLYDGKFC